jgi:hypothetical protein
MPRAFASAHRFLSDWYHWCGLHGHRVERRSANMLHKDCGSRIQQQLYCEGRRNIDRTETVKGCSRVDNT